MKRGMNSTRRTFVSLALALLYSASAVTAADEEPLADRLMDHGRQELTVLRIRAALADRKDIRARYIRVRHDGKAVNLAGFVKDPAQSSEAEKIARTIAAGSEVRGFWAYEPDLDERDAYMTRIGEQATDAEIWARIQVALRGPPVRHLLADADIQAVDVRHGKVRVLLIAESPEGLVDLAPHLTPVQGVAEVSQSTVKAFTESKKETDNP